LRKSLKRESARPRTSPALDADEVVGEVAHVGEELGAEETGAAGGEGDGELALGAEDLTERGEVLTDVDDALGERLLAAGEDGLLDGFDLAAEFVEGGLEVVDDEVEEGVGEAVGSADEDARGAENAFAAGLDGLEGGRWKVMRKFFPG
jgi:hypothetical protein